MYQEPTVADWGPDGTEMHRTAGLPPRGQDGGS